MVERCALPTMVVWHRLQSWGKPAAAWFGLVVPLKSVRWQEMHAVGSPANTLFL